MDSRSRASTKLSIHPVGQNEYLALSNGLIYRQGTKRPQSQSGANKTMKRTFTNGMNMSSQKLNERESDTQTRSSVKGTLV
jgi:hypothetical protein